MTDASGGRSSAEPAARAATAETDGEHQSGPPSAITIVNGCLAALLALAAVVLLSNPCGGGDLCVGGLVGLYAGGAALVMVLFLGVRSALKLSSPIAAADVAIATLAASVLGSLRVLSATSSLRGPNAGLIVLLGIGALMLVVGLKAVAEVRPHSIERTVLLVTLVAITGLALLSTLFAAIVPLVAIAMLVLPRSPSGPESPA